MGTSHHPSPVGSTQTTDYAMRNPETEGEIRASITDYHPNSTTGFGEPSEVAYVTLTFTSEDESYTNQKYAQVVSVAPNLRRFRTGEEKQWVREVWANEADEDGNLVTRRGAGSRHNQLFQFSTPKELNWDMLLEETLDHANRVFG